GSVPGALLGGFLLAMLESFWAGYVSAIYKDVFAFAVLVVVLIFRPEGLLGASENTDRG
ncbi:MAG: branched-chain amino acid ABC transporter permease LivH, partial [Nitrospinaceae bacterium]|nr:branched-chain amino acid ABC transporter permease LivH [Nitrospinaceae bacterium]